jgi:transaldolase
MASPHVGVRSADADRRVFAGHHVRRSRDRCANLANTPTPPAGGEAMTQNINLSALSAAGVSVWLDDLSRDRLTSGNLQQLIDTRSVVGVTTNPSIFLHAISHGQAYTRQLTQLAERGADAESAIRTVITDDVRAACDVLRPQWETSRGVDGRVSIEVDPRLADDTEATVTQAAELWKIIDRPNLFIKIPATTAGMPAITATVAEGISVNVTLIFSVKRHRQAMDAYLAGLEAAHQAGRDLTGIHSVASLFVSRVDTEIDQRLEAIGTDAARALRGQAAIANARLAYAAYQDVFEAGTRYAALSYAGAHVQRPLWASTGVKNPAYPDTMYVTELIAPLTVSTIPEQTLEALADHGVIVADSITGTVTDAQTALDNVTAVGVDLSDVFGVLENQGVGTFATSWQQLLDAYPTSAATAANVQGRGEPDR